MKLGFSLSPGLLRGNIRNKGEQQLLSYFGNPKKMLEKLLAKGISSIELRYIARDIQDDFEDIFRLIWEHGLQVTIHGRIEGISQGTRFTGLYPSLKYVLQHYQNYQEQLVITLHAFSGIDDQLEKLSRTTIHQINHWIGLIREEELNIQIAIELTRLKEGKTDPGANIESLLQLIRQLQDERCGICWDMGHYYSNRLQTLSCSTLPGEPIKDLPADEFIQRTIHTHIHGLNERCRTHFPMLLTESLPLETYVNSLQKAGYTGIYNLELECQRFVDYPDLLEQVWFSIERLQACRGVSNNS